VCGKVFLAETSNSRRQKISHEISELFPGHASAGIWYRVPELDDKAGWVSALELNTRMESFLVVESKGKILCNLPGGRAILANCKNRCCALTQPYLRSLRWNSILHGCQQLYPPEESVTPAAPLHLDWDGKPLRQQVA
jgi:hypothetical protein